MNKIINSPEAMVLEMLEGYLCANPQLVEKVSNTNGLVLKERLDKVALVTGGGAGNEPWSIGYVGYGLADGVALGHVYAAPPARAIMNVTKAVNHQKGVLFVATNHAGDVLNFELAAELLQMEGIQTRCVYVTDDIATAPPKQREERRGVAGVAIVLKIAGAAAAAGCDLTEVARLAQKANDNLRTFGVTTSPGYLPSTGQAMFKMEEGTIEFGMGFNGEPGIMRMKLQPADTITDYLMEQLLADLQAVPKEEVAVFLNGFGFTGLLELCIVNRRIKAILDQKKLKTYDMFIDTLLAPQGTGGFSITLLKLDDELKPYYNWAAESPFFHKREMT